MPTYRVIIAELGAAAVGQSARAHVGVADGFNFFQVVFGDDLVEGLETGIEFRD